MFTAKALGLAAVSMLTGLLYDDTTVRVMGVVAASCLAVAAYANYQVRHRALTVPVSTGVR